MSNVVSPYLPLPWRLPARSRFGEGRGEGGGAAAQSGHNHTGGSTGTMAPDGEGGVPFTQKSVWIAIHRAS
jgi:hypothetical protein